jgi:hypothetical protein
MFEPHFLICILLYKAKTSSNQNLSFKQENLLYTPVLIKGFSAFFEKIRFLRILHLTQVVAAQKPKFIPNPDSSLSKQ